MAAPTEKPTVDTTISSCYEGVGKASGKRYMNVTLGNGQKTTNFDIGMFQDFSDAKESGVQVRLALYRSPKGYTSIDSIDPVPKAGAPPAKHFIGAGGAPPGTPGTPENPGPRPAPAASGNGGVPANSAGPLNVHQDAYLCRAFSALAAGMVAWGGRFCQSEEEFWKLVAKVHLFVETDAIPGIRNAAVPAQVKPIASPGEEMSGYDEDL